MALLPTPATSNNDQARMQIASYANGLVRTNVSRRTQLNCDNQAEVNINLFLGYKNKSPALIRGRRYAANRIQLVNVGNAAVQVGDRPKIKFTPRESGEAPVYYFNTKAQVTSGPAIQSLVAMVRPECIHGGIDPVTQQQTPPQPLNDQEVQFVQQSIQQGKMLTQQAMATGQQAPDVVPPEILIAINDATATEALQEVFDAMWEECGADQKMVEHVLYNGIIGWQHLLYEFDDETKRHILYNPEFLCVFQDPFKTDVKDAYFVVYDQFLTREEGIALFPDLKDQINAHAHSGRPEVPGEYYYRLPLAYQQTEMYQETVILRTLWLRYQQYPLTPEQALATGKVRAQQVPVDPPEQPGLISRGITAMKAMIGIKPPAEKPIDAIGSEDGQQGSVDQDEQTTPDEPSAPAMRQAFVHTKTDKATGEQSDEEIDQQHPAWPTRTGIRQIRIMVNQVVDDRECEHVDIPMCQNVNIPIWQTPFGQGEPERLEPLQAAINNIISDLVEHHDYSAFPTQFVPESVANAMPAAVRSMYVKPGARFTVKDTLFTQFAGKMMSTQEPPEVPKDSYQMLEVFLRLIDDESDRSKVLQGQASPSWSGQAIGQLQTAAKSSILFKSGRTEDMLKYLARLMEGSILRRISPEDLAKSFRKYPVQVWYALHNWMNNMERDIAVEITSGSGSSKQSQITNLIQAQQGGVPISPQTILGQLDLDPEVQMQEIGQWQRDMAANQPQPMAPSPMPGGPAAPSPAAQSQ